MATVSSPKRLIAIDPGERVGWATGVLADGIIELDTHGISELKPFAIKLGERIADYDTVIYETYRLSAVGAKQIGDDLQTSQLIGMIRYLAWTSGTKLVAQSPKIKTTADKVAKGDFKRLIEAEPGTHDDAHDIDAIRHLAYYGWKQQVKEAARGKQARPA